MRLNVFIASPLKSFDFPFPLSYNKKQVSGSFRLTPTARLSQNCPDWRMSGFFIQKKHGANASVLYIPAGDFVLWGLLYFPFFEHALYFHETRQAAALVFFQLL